MARPDLIDSENRLAGPLAMNFYGLVLGILTTWRLTHLLNAEDGPWDVLVGLRRLAGSGFWAKLLDCFYCLSVWIAAPLAYVIGRGWGERLLLWPSLSAGAILAERLTSKEQSVVPPALYLEDKEDLDAVLRRGKEENAGSRSQSPGE